MLHFFSHYGQFSKLTTRSSGLCALYPRPQERHPLPPAFQGSRCFCAVDSHTHSSIQPHPQLLGFWDHSTWMSPIVTFSSLCLSQNLSSNRLSNFLIPDCYQCFPNSQTRSDKSDLLMLLSQPVLPGHGPLPRGRPSLVSCSSSRRAQVLLPLVHNDCSPLRIIFEFRLYSPSDLTQYSVLFFCLNSLTHWSSGGRDPLSTPPISGDAPPSLKLSRALIGSGSLLRPGLPKHPFPSLLEFPSPGVIVIYINLCPSLSPEC